MSCWCPIQPGMLYMHGKGGREAQETTWRCRRNAKASICIGGCNINLNDLEWCHHGWSMMVVETHMFLKMLGWNRIICTIKCGRGVRSRYWDCFEFVLCLNIVVAYVNDGELMYFTFFTIYLFLRNDTAMSHVLFICNVPKLCAAILHHISIVLWHVRPFCLLLHCFPTTTAFQCEVSNGNQWNRGDTSCRGAKISGVVGNCLQMESIEAERRKQEELESFEARKREEDAIGWSPLTVENDIGLKWREVPGCNRM